MSASIIKFPTKAGLHENLQALVKRNRRKNPTPLNDQAALLIVEQTVSRLIASMDPTTAILLCMAREHLTAAYRISQRSKPEPK